MSEMMINDQRGTADDHEAIRIERNAELAWSRMCVAQKADKADFVITLVTCGLDDTEIAEQLGMTRKRVEAIRLAITT